MKCFECDIEGELENHHVIPRSLGGKKTIKLCLSCHSKVHKSKFRRDTHSNLIKEAIQRTREKGTRLGRPAGVKNSPLDLLKKHQNIVYNLKNGQSVRNTSKITGRGFSTVQRVKAVWLKQRDTNSYKET